MNTILVYPCKTRVLIKDINIAGYITGINIRNNNITYEISYFIDKGCFTNCFYDYQLIFDGENQEKIEIGFRQNE
jgi:hypothetical protein